MNGKTKKYLARVARSIMKSEGIKLGEGYNQYNQAMNCHSWAPAYQDGHEHDWENEDNNDGHMLLRDPDGDALIKPTKTPGTITTAYKFRSLVQNLKRLWKQTNGKHEVFDDYPV